MSAGQPCQNCGHPNSGDAMFCSKCGTKTASVSQAAPVPPSQAPPPEPEPPVAPASVPPSAAPVAQKPRRAVAKTMLGMGKPEQDAIEAARKQAAETRARKEAEREAAEAAAPPPRHGAQGRTMLGMPAPQKAQVQAAVEAARKKADEKAVRKAGQSERPGAKPEAALDPMTNRTMLGQPAPKRPESVPPKRPEGLAPQPTPPRQRAPVMYPTNTGEEDAMTLPTRKPPRGLAAAALGVGLVILVIGGGALAYSLFSGGSELNATVVQGEGGEMLEIEVPGAEGNVRVRFGGEELELEAGRARFPLSADDLSIGDNELSVDVVDADGSVESHTVDLHLEMRVRADVGPLANLPPAIDVVVEAPPGSEATLDGEALELDAHGRGTRRFEIDGTEASAEGVVEHVVHYRVHPPDSEGTQGELHTRIPLTTLQLDRPGVQLVTDREAVDFAGAVAPGSSVTIGGEEVTVNMGRFLHTHPLPSVGEHTVEVIARAPGRAPHVSTSRIRRVEDLAAEAESFEFNAELTYARVAQHPSTYQGQAVSFEGLVYNVDVSDGQSVLQILVSECPQGDRCPLWVSYSAATEAELRSRVRVLGTVAGEQQFRSQSGQVRTVPRVDATFVLPVQDTRRR